MIRIQLTVWFTQADQETLPTRHFIMLTSVCGKTLDMEVWFGARIRELFEDEDDFGSQHGPTNWFGGGSKYRRAHPTNRKHVFFLFGKALKPYTNPMTCQIYQPNVVLQLILRESISHPKMIFQMPGKYSNHQKMIKTIVHHDSSGIF